MVAKKLFIVIVACYIQWIIAYRKKLNYGYSVAINRKEFRYLSKHSVSTRHDEFGLETSTVKSKTRILRVLQSAVTGVVIAASLRKALPANAVEALLNFECADSITVFRNFEKNRTVIMIGTAHISEDSALLVRKAIQTVRPDTVMIELDRKRIGKVTDPIVLERNGFILPKQSEVDNEILMSAQDPTYNYSAEDKLAATNSLSQNQKESILDSLIGKVVSPIKTIFQRTAGSILGKALGQFYSSVEKLGFTPGGEFQAAVQEGRAIGSNILLGDRDVDITLQRLATAVGTVSPTSINKMAEKLTSVEKELGLDISDNSMNKEQLSKFVEQLKQRDVINKVMGVLQGELPTVYNALVGERDEFMANSIIGSDSSVLVGVVGLAHLAGIEKYLARKGNFVPVKKNCPSQ